MNPRTTVRLRGTLSPPGDKSIGHRLGFLSAVAKGRSELARFPTGQDCRSTLELVRALGVEVHQDGDTVKIEGRGAAGLQAPRAALDAGNSGTTARLAAGILAAQPFDSRLVGDESLSRRPFDRVIRPLTQMGGAFASTEGCLPLDIRGGRRLSGIDYPLPIPSAQVKTAVLLAGLFASGRTTVRETVPSRNHTEIALRAYGASITTDADALCVSVTGGSSLTGGVHRVPGDFSSAAFLIGAAAFLPGSDLVVENVGLNPTRTGFLDTLEAMGADIEVETTSSDGADVEPYGTVRVRGGGLHGTAISSEKVPALIDEVPILAVVAAFAEGETHLKGLSELRVKESDRLSALSEGLLALGVDAQVSDDSLVIRGGAGKLRAAHLRSHGDHRMVMAWAIASLGLAGECEIDHLENVRISYPGFWEALDHLAA